MKTEYTKETEIYEAKETILGKNMFKLKKLFIFTLFFLVILTASFAMPQAEIEWSTIRGDNVSRVIPMTSVKQEIMQLLNQYQFVEYHAEAGTRDSKLSSLIQTRRQFRSMGVDNVQAYDQITSWLQNNSNINFAYALFESSMGMDSISVVVVNRDRVFGIIFKNDSSPMSANTTHHSTRQSLDLFERHIDQILR